MSEEITPNSPQDKPAQAPPAPFRSIGDIARQIQEKLIAGAGNAESTDQYDS